MIELKATHAAPRLDQFLTELVPDHSRTQLQKLIRQEQILLNQCPTRPNSTVQMGDIITIDLPPAPSTIPQPEPIPLNIIYEDPDLIVINKPVGMVVHPAHGHQSGTLVNALLARYPDMAALAESAEQLNYNEEAPLEFENPTNPTDRPGIVHRLDRDTSGLMVVARTTMALHHLQQQFKARTVEKTYLALVFGCPPAPEGVIDVPLGRDPRYRQRIAPLADGKPARTHYRLREYLNSYSLLEVGLETGRTHQIRVHLAWLKCPVVGDTVYGHKKNSLALPRQFLHAWRLRFTHPRSHEILSMEAPLPADLQTVLTRLQEK